MSKSKSFRENGFHFKPFRTNETTAKQSVSRVFSLNTTNNLRLGKNVDNLDGSSVRVYVADGKKSISLILKEVLESLNFPFLITCVDYPDWISNFTSEVLIGRLRFNPPLYLVLTNVLLLLTSPGNLVGK